MLGNVNIIIRGEIIILKVQLNLIFITICTFEFPNHYNILIHFLFRPWSFAFISASLFCKSWFDAAP